MNYLITGGTGFIGQNFIKSLSPQEDHVTVLSRSGRSRKSTSNLGRNCEIINGLSQIKDSEFFDCIINLAGKPIDCRWTQSAKKQLIDSRVETTLELIARLKRLSKKPKVMISASAIGYYGSDHDAILDENARPKNDFTHQLCNLWEQAALKAEPYGVRVCIARLGVVLGKNGGFIKKTYLPFKLGLGGSIGEGKQRVSWIHIEDVIKGFKYLIAHQTCSGHYNFTAPNAVTNQMLTQSIGKALNRPTLCHLPTSVVKLIFGEMGKTLLLKGNAIVPKKLLAAGYTFQYTDLKKALSNIYETP